MKLARYAIYVIVLTTILFGAWLISATVAHPEATPSPGVTAPTGSPSASPTTSALPTPSATPTPEPAPQATVHWARHWHKVAVTNRSALARWRWCFGWSTRHYSLPREPRRSQSRQEWAYYGTRCKHRAVHFHRECLRLSWRAQHPSPLRSVYDWRPLVRHVWRYHPQCVEQALTIMRRESGGDPYAKNPSSTAKGLFQILAPLNRWWVPIVNVRCAYRYYLRSGWQPWSLTCY